MEYQPTPHSERWFRVLIGLFPRDFRDRFGAEMTQVFADQVRVARRDRGGLGLIRLWLRTLPGVIRAAFLEHREAPRPAPRPNNGSEPMLETLKTDLRLAGRRLRQSPVFALVAVACIALGCGAVTTIYSAMNALVLRPLPGTSAGDRLVRIERKRPGGTDGVSLTYPQYRQLRDLSRTLDGVVAWGKTSLVLRGGQAPGEAVYGNLVSGNLFRVLGVTPLLGRFFAPDEDETELANPVIVVSEGYWRIHLAADSAAVGRDILVNGHPFTLIGVAPKAFQGMDTPIRTDAWVPLHMQRAIRPGDHPLEDVNDTWIRTAARIRRGVSLIAARQEMAALGQAISTASTGPQLYRVYSELRLSPLTGLPPDATGPLAGFLGLLLGAGAMVLVISSVNVAGMLSARALHRQREMAVRAALGAGRGRLTRQLLTETLVLFALGAMGGVAVAFGATRALERLPIPTAVPIQLSLAPDLRVLGFALLVSLLTGLLVGLAPTRRALAPDVATRLRDGSTGSAARRTFAGNAMVVGQLAVSLVLLLGAGLLGRGLLRAARIDPGFDSSGVVTVPFDVEAWGYDEAHGRRFYQALEQRLTALPGVQAVSFTTILPLNFQGSEERIDLPGAVPGGVPIEQLLVGPGYFNVLRIPLISGRPIGTQDDEHAGRVAVINQTMARRYWPDGSALGQSFRYHDQPVTVVGIARDARYASLTEQTPALAYFPVAQEWRALRSLIVRSTLPAPVIALALARTIHETDAAAPRVAVTTLKEATGVALIPGRVAAMVTGVLGIVGLLLSVAGLYGVIAYSAARRTREIGIRLALGAPRRAVLRLILKEGVGLAVTGVAVGLGLAALATPLLKSLLFGMSALDPSTYLLMPTILVSVALLASYLPARRAAGGDPMAALRAE